MSTPITTLLQQERPGFLTPTPLNQKSLAKLREEFPWSSIKKADIAVILDEPEYPVTPVTKKAPVKDTTETPPTFDQLRRYLQNIEELPIIHYNSEEVAEIDQWYNEFLKQVKPGYYLELIKNVAKRIEVFKENLSRN